MSKRIYKKVTGWSLFLEESKEANPDPNKSAQQFKAEMQKAYAKLPKSAKDDFRDKAREVNARLAEAKKIGIGGFLDELKAERLKPAEQQGEEFQEDAALQLINHKNRWKSRAEKKREKIRKEIQEARKYQAPVDPRIEKARSRFKLN